MLQPTNRTFIRAKRFIGFVRDKFVEFYYSCVERKLTRSFSVASHLTYSERSKLLKLSRNRASIVEIGSYTGASACCFGAALKEQGAGKLICIDTWNNDAMTEGCRDTWGEFQDNTIEYKNFIMPIRGFSTDVVEAVRKITRRIDLLFIDGDHSYSAVKADWDTYKNFLVPGSIVIFHDYGWAAGVRRLVHEDVMDLVSNNESLPNMWWGQIGQLP